MTARAGSSLEEKAIAILAEAGFGAPTLQHKFAAGEKPPRRWQFDLAWPEMKVALEIEGGTWNGGRHTAGGGYRKDVDKYNAAALLGWVVVKATTDMLKPEILCPLVMRAFDLRIGDGDVNGYQAAPAAVQYIAMERALHPVISFAEEQAALAKQRPTRRKRDTAAASKTTLVAS